MELIGLFGQPIKQSLSPEMHNYIFEKLNLKYRYFAFDINPDRIKQSIDAIRALKLVGANVTIPYKETVIPFLDELDSTAINIKAVNTIVNKNGYLVGYNTDGEGYVTSLETEMDIRIADKNVVVIGAGGAARGIIYSLLNKKCKSISVINRNISKAKIIVDDFVKFGDIKIGENDKSAILDADIIINTTPVGMFPNVDESPIDNSFITNKHIVSDIIYNPLQTKFLNDALQKGAKIHNGIGMFVHQGAIAFQKWTGINPPINDMYSHVREILERRHNYNK